DPTTILPAAGSRLAHAVLSAVLSGLERFTGLGLIREVGDFVRVIDDLTGALRARIGAVGALLRSADTAPFLVTAPEPRLVAETGVLAKALAGIGITIEGIVVNRALPRGLYGSAAADPGAPDGVSPSLAGRLAGNWGDLRTFAARQEATLAP